jgi:putative ABC transport system permease protein
MSELRVSVRRLLHSPGYIFVVVLSLGVGIAASVAAFSLTNTLIFRDVPGTRDRRNLIRVKWSNQEGTFTASEFAAFESRQPLAFTTVAAQGDRSMPVLLPPGPATLTTAFVSARFFETLGTRPVSGRVLNQRDALADALPVAVISEHLWRVPFGARDVVGSSITVGGRPFTIVGIVPAEMPGLRPIDLGIRESQFPQVWLTLRHLSDWRATTRSDPWLWVAGRFSTDASLREARSEAAAMANWLRGITPLRERTRSERASLILFRAGLHWRDEPAQSLLTIALFLFLPVCVLMIGCVNVMSLQLARGLEHSAELSVRLALGASRSAIVRMMSVEVLILSAASGAVGWTGAHLVLTRAHSFFPTRIVVDECVFLFVICLVFGIVAVSGLFPAWLASRDIVAAGLRTLPEGNPVGPRARGVLLIVQVAASVGLLALSSLAIRSVVGRSPTLPIDASQILLVDFNLADIRPTAPRTDLFVATVLDRLNDDSAIRAAGFASFTMAGGPVAYSSSDDAPGVRRMAVGGFVTPGWFDAMNATFLAGVGFSRAVAPHSQAVVNSALAATLGGGSSALGTELRLSNGERFAVVGIVADTEHSGDGTPTPMLYLPFSSAPPASLTLVARTRDTSVARRAIEAAIKDADPLVLNGGIESLERRSAESFRGFREVASYGLTLSALALALAAAGLHSLLTYSVRRRRREIGVRVAVGATASQVVWVVVRPTLRLVVAGFVLGLALALPIAALMRSAFLGLSSFDGVALLPSLAVFVLVALAASSAPALHASRIDPVRALREL